MVAGVLAITVVPVSAGAGGASALGVQPAEVSLGGQPNDCSASITGRLPSAADYELRITNPQDGVTYAGTGGVSFTLGVAGDDKTMDFVVNGPAVVFDLVVKGGQKSTHYDYDGNGGPGGATADQNLHAPTKGNGSNLFSISHVSFCYEDAFPATGNVYVDVNQDGDRDPGEGADAPRVITAYDAGVPVASTNSDANGVYSIYLQAGGTYTICEEAISDFVQTDPSNTNCSGLGEEGGHSVPAIAAPVRDLDFGNAPEICGQLLEDQFDVFDVSFRLFDAGNGEVGCDNKIGLLSFTPAVGGEPVQVNLPITGSLTGEVAGIGIITKEFGLNPAFVPLEYKQGGGDTTFEVLPWCVLRAKGSNDGDEFDPYLADDLNYPSLAGVFDDPGTDLEPSVSCKISEDENSEGTQITVVLIQDDPFWH